MNSTVAALVLVGLCVGHAILWAYALSVLRAVRDAPATIVHETAVSVRSIEAAAREVRAERQRNGWRGSL